MPIALAAAVLANRQDKLLLAGTANLARTEEDFTGSIFPVLEAIEEQVTLLRLFGEMEVDLGGVSARIGRENATFGLGETSKWVIVAIAVFFQVFFSTLAGVVNIDRIYLDVAVNFGASRWQAYRTIALPAALPFIFTGCQLGLGMALIVVVIAENFGTQVGVGFLIWRSWQIFEVRDMYVGLIVVALMGYCFQLLLQRLQKAIIPWKKDGGA